MSPPRWTLPEAREALIDTAKLALIAAAFTIGWRLAEALNVGGW